MHTWIWELLGKKAVGRKFYLVVISSKVRNNKYRLLKFATAGRVMIKFAGCKHANQPGEKLQTK